MDVMYSNTFTRVTDYGGLEDGDESHEGVSVPQTMARRHGKQSSEIVHYEVSFSTNYLVDYKHFFLARHLISTSLIGTGLTPRLHRPIVPIATPQ